jgi:hypothetical protein
MNIKQKNTHDKKLIEILDRKTDSQGKTLYPLLRLDNHSSSWQPIKDLK